MPSTRVKIRPSQPMHIAVPVAEPGPLPTSALRAGDTRFPFLPPPRSTALLRKAETALMTAATVSPLYVISLLLAFLEAEHNKAEPQVKRLEFAGHEVW